MIYYTVIFLIFSIILIIFALRSISSRNIVHSIVWLSLFLFTLSALFFYLGSSLIGSLEILVYVGAVVTLLAFTLMLTGGKEFE